MSDDVEKQIPEVVLTHHDDARRSAHFEQKHTTDRQLHNNSEIDQHVQLVDNGINTALAMMVVMAGLKSAIFLRREGRTLQVIGYYSRKPHESPARGAYQYSEWLQDRIEGAEGALLVDADNLVRLPFLADVSDLYSACLMPVYVHGEIAGILCVAGDADSHAKFVSHQQQLRALAMSMEGCLLPIEQGCTPHTSQAQSEQALLLEVKKQPDVDLCPNESESYMAFLLEGSPVVIYTCMPEGDFPATFVSENVRSLFGFQPSQFLDEPGFWAENIHPEDKARVFADLGSLFVNDRHSHEYRFRTNDGGYVWVHDELKLYRDAAGKPTIIIGYWADVSAQKNSERLLKNSERKYRSVLEVTTEGYWLIDPLSRKTLEVNGSLCRILGYTPDEIVGHTPLEFVDDANREIFKAQTARILETDHRTYEIGLRHRSGVNIPCIFHASTVRDESGVPLYAVALVTDISDLKRAEQLLKVATERAEQASRAKSEFIANMSHEIRTPMNAVINLSYLALQSGLNQKQYDYISKVKSAGEGLLGIVNDILDMAKVESGRLELNKTRFDLNGIIVKIHEMFSFAAVDKGLSFEIYYPYDGKRPLIGDPVRLRQILVNLIGNAIKFTEKGRVALHISEQLDGDTLLCRFQVTDTGIGITEAQQQRLFAPFSQVDSSTTRRYGGTGLGLSISKRLAEMMDGTITLHSQFGKGSTFTLTVPLVVDLQAPLTSLQEQYSNHKSRLRELSGGSVLLVEDNLANQIVAREFLEARGLVVTIANHGLEAVKLVQGAAFDMILMDVQMPVMDGYEATMAIRALPAGKTIPIIAMTAHAMPEEQQRCHAAGMNEHMAKPFDIEQLDKILLRWLPKRHAPQGNQASAQPAGTEAIPVLDGIDIGDALKRIGGRWDSYRRVLTAFKKSNHDVLQRLESQLSASDVESAKRTVHSLKGVAGTIGALDLYHSAVDLEAILRKGEGNVEASRIRLGKETERIFRTIDKLEKDEVAPRVDTNAPMSRQQLCEHLRALHQLMDDDVVGAQHYLHREFVGIENDGEVARSLGLLRVHLSTYNIDAAQMLCNEMVARCEQQQGASELK